MEVCQSNGFLVTFWSLFGGLCLLVTGLGANWLRRVVEDTPVSRIRSMTMGRVAVSGCASEPTLLAPITGMPCVYYEYRITRHEGQKSFPVDEGDSRRMPLLLRGQTGDVWLDLEWANLRLKDAAMATEDMGEWLREHLRARGIEAPGRLRAEEIRIDPGQPLTVLGVARPLGHRAHRRFGLLSAAREALSQAAALSPATSDGATVSEAALQEFEGNLSRSARRFVSRTIRGARKAASEREAETQATSQAESMSTLVRNEASASLERLAAVRDDVWREGPEPKAVERLNDRDRLLASLSLPAPTLADAEIRTLIGRPDKGRHSVPFMVFGRTPEGLRRHQALLANSTLAGGAVLVAGSLAVTGTGYAQCIEQLIGGLIGVSMIFGCIIAGSLVYLYIKAANERRASSSRRRG